MLRLFRIPGLDRVLQEIDMQSPVAIYETKRLPTRGMGNWIKILDVLGGIEFIFTLPGFWVPFVHWLWRLPTIIASANIVSHEFEDKTWNTLRATTLSVREIIMAKYAAIMLYMEPHYTLIMYIRAAPVLIFGISWGTSTLTVLPEEGFAYWFSTSWAFAAAGLYLVISPWLDTAFDAAIGVLASTLSGQRSTSLIIATLLRLAGFLMPMALVIPVQSGMLGGPPMTVIQLRAIAIVVTFGPAYAFLWGLGTWVSVGIVAAWIALKLGLIRVMLNVAVARAEAVEI